MSRTVSSISKKICRTSFHYNIKDPAKLESPMFLDDSPVDSATYILSDVGNQVRELSRSVHVATQQIEGSIRDVAAENKHISQSISDISDLIRELTESQARIREDFAVLATVSPGRPVDTDKTSERDRQCECRTM